MSQSIQRHRLHLSVPASDWEIWHLLYMPRGSEPLAMVSVQGKQLDSFLITFLTPKSELELAATQHTADGVFFHAPMVLQSTFWWKLPWW